jgi:hypothetical protein
MAGTDVEGSVVVKTSDAGVVFERITYFKTPWPMMRS